MKAKRMKDNKEQNINEEEYKYGAYERKLERAEYKIKKKNKGLKIFLRVLIVIIVIITMVIQCHKSLQIRLF